MNDQPDRSTRRTLVAIAGFLAFTVVGSGAGLRWAVGPFRGPGAVLGISPDNLEFAVMAGLAIGAVGLAITFAVSRFYSASVAFVSGAICATGLLAMFSVVLLASASI